MLSKREVSHHTFIGKWMYHCTNIYAYYGYDANQANLNRINSKCKMCLLMFGLCLCMLMFVNVYAWRMVNKMFIHLWVIFDTLVSVCVYDSLSSNVKLSFLCDVITSMFMYLFKCANMCVYLNRERACFTRISLCLYVFYVCVDKIE